MPFNPQAFSWSAAPSSINAGLVGLDWPSFQFAFGFSLGALEFTEFALEERDIFVKWNKVCVFYFRKLRFGVCMVLWGRCMYGSVEQVRAPET